MSQENVDQNELDNDLIDDEDAGLDAEVDSESEAPAENSKQKEFLKKYGMYVAMGVVAVGIVGYKMVASPAKPTLPVPQNQAQVQPQVNPAIPSQEMQASSPEMEAQNGNSPSQVDPMQQQAQASVASAPELKPLQQEVVGENKQPLNPMEAHQSTQPSGNQQNNAAPLTGEMTRALTDLKGSVDRLVDVQTKMDTKVSNLEARVSALENSVTTKTQSVASSKVHHKAAMVDASEEASESKKRKVKKVKEQKPASHVAAVKLEEKKGSDDSLLESAPEVTQEIMVPKKEVPAPKLRAVMKGRFWIATPEGETSFSSEATLPNGAKVIKIDPENNQVITSKGVLKMPKE